MKIFITGATGYIGSAVARELKKRGNEIIALVRTEHSASQVKQAGYLPVMGDMLQPGQWKAEAAKADAFIHCAQIRFGKRVGADWVRRAAEADQVCLKGLIEAAKQNRKIKALIYTSGISVVGDYRDEWTDENTAPKRGITVGSYHLNGERLIVQAFKDGLPAFSLRPSLPISSAGTFANFFLSPAAKRYVGDGENFFPTVHLADLANGYALALESAPAGECIILSDDEPYRMKRFLNTILQELGGGETKSIPHWLISLLAGKPLANLLISSYRVKNIKAKKILGWKLLYPTFKDSIKQAVLEYKNQVTMN